MPTYLPTIRHPGAISCVTKVEGCVPGAPWPNDLVATYNDEAKRVRVDSFEVPEFWLEVDMFCSPKAKGRVRGARGNNHFAVAYDRDTKVLRVESTAVAEFWVEVQLV